MPFNCDICGEECVYGKPTKVFELRNSKQEVIICGKCLRKK